MGLKDGIWPQEWNLGLKDRIRTLRLGFRPRDWDLGLIVGFGSGGGTEKEKKEEKIPHMCESIGHRPLQGAAREGHTALSVRTAHAHV